MGEPVKILDLAKQMIALSGLSIFDAATNPEGDIQIKFIGLNSEKLFEELLIGDAARGTDHKKISVAHETCLPEEELGKLLEDISKSKSEMMLACCTASLRLFSPFLVLRKSRSGKCLRQRCLSRMG